jgi:predicted metal-binding protein
MSGLQTASIRRLDGGTITMDQNSTAERPARRGARGTAPALHVCVTCRWRGLETLEEPDIRPGQHLHDLVMARANPAQRAQIKEIVCLTHCLNACNAVAMQRGKPPLLMTRMAPDEAAADALLAMLETYGASADGIVAPDDVPDAIPLARPLVPPRGARRGGAG